MKTKTVYREQRERQQRLIKITIAYFILAVLLSGFAN